MINPENKPCLVQAGQGFSVKYNEKFLYSKYNPAKNILSVIENLMLLPDSLIICVSPLLGYGLNELINKLPENCKLIGVEFDENLFALSKTELEKLNIPEETFTFLTPHEAKLFPKKLNDSFNGEYKRVIKIDFSAGNQFFKAEYDSFFIILQNIINQFWKNRITLVKFGRKYSSNLIKNLKLLPESKPFFYVSKPIIIIGAGESALDTLLSIKDSSHNFFIIAVDAALKALSALKIKADAVICEESQSIISGCFKGCKNAYDTLFLSLTSSNNVAKFDPQRNIFYTTRYASSEFLKNLEKAKIVENPLPPLGSVGLTSVQIALKIRLNESVPVFVTGMDFSFSCGNTHIKSSFHENERRKVSSRLKTFENFGGSFNNSALKAVGKDKKTVFTTQTMLNYRNLFEDRFSDTKNLFDIGKTGLPLGIKQTDLPEELFSSEKKDFSRTHSSVTENSSHTENDSPSPNSSLMKNDSPSPNSSPTENDSPSPNSSPTENNSPTRITSSSENSSSLPHTISSSSSINQYLLNEKNTLLYLRDILSGKITLSEEERNKKILEIIKPREYLYLHFPDGYKVNLSLGFLKRVRTELDYFIKILSD